MKILGIVLIVLGCLALVYGGFSFISHDRVADVGGISLWADREHNVWISPVVGILAVAGGAAMIVLSGKRSAV